MGKRTIHYEELECDRCGVVARSHTGAFVHGATLWMEAWGQTHDGTATGYRVDFVLCGECRGRFTEWRNAGKPPTA